MGVFWLYFRLGLFHGPFNIHHYYFLLYFAPAFLLVTVYIYEGEELCCLAQLHLVQKIMSSNLNRHDKLLGLLMNMHEERITQSDLFF